MILKDVTLKIGSGATPRGGNSVYSDSGVTFIRSQNVLDYSFSADGLVYIDDNHAKQLENVAVREGDVLLNITGDSVARACLVPAYRLPARVNQHVSIVRVDPDLANHRYILYQLQALKNLLLSYSHSGATRKALTKAMLENLEILLPSLSEQESIANTLSCLDAKIEVNNKTNANLEQQAQSIFKSWFVDFEPFQHGEFVESELGLIPEGWSVSALADAIDVNPARSLKKGSLATHLDMANVPTSGSRALSWKQREFTSGTRFTNGDVLIARITPCLENGKTAFVDFLSDGEIGWGSTEFIVMRSRESWPVEYAYCLARYEPFRAHLIGSMTGTSGRQRVQIDALKQYLVATAKDAEIYTEFGEIVSPLFASIRKRAEGNQVLSALRDALLPKLMSGEIEVPVD